MAKVKKLTFTGALVIALPVLLIGYFSQKPEYGFNSPNESELVVSFRYTSRKMHPCTDKELKRLTKERRNRPKHMQSARNICGSRERVPVNILVEMDGKTTFDRLIYPSGFTNDGACYLFKRLIVTSGEHELKVTLSEIADTGKTAKYLYEGKPLFPTARRVVVDFNLEAMKLHLTEPTP
jgi:hypothetical protein